MDDEKFFGFHENTILNSMSLSEMFAEIVKRRENCVAGFEDANNSLTLKLNTDNDSGYISQNVESNSVSSLDENNAPVILCSDNVYVNEDALLEKPESLNVAEPETDEYEEFGHLYYMSSNSRIDSSFVSQKTTFSGFDSSESIVSNVSNVISVTTPLVLHSSNPIVNELENDSNYDYNVINSDDNICDKIYEQLPININNIQNNILEDSYNNTLSFSSALCNIYETGFGCKPGSSTRPTLETSINESPSIKSYTELTTITKRTKSPQRPTSTPSNLPTSRNLELSPELFSDEEVTSSFEITQPPSTLKSQKNEQTKENKNDSMLIKRLHESLSGMPPPPSVTILQISVDEMLQKIKENESLLVKHFEKSENGYGSSILVNCQKEDFDGVEFPNLMKYRYHGLQYNRCKTHEDLEYMYVRYAERYIGAETQSSCTVFGVGNHNLSPTKRKLKLRRVAKSPGKRLSHLARRRITFSKDSLQAATSSNNNSFIGSRTRQIMIDARKCEMLSRRRSPYKKRTPVKVPTRSPRKKLGTPSSSAKKRYALRAQMFDADESIDSVSSVSTTCSSLASSTKKVLFKCSPVKGQSTNGLLRLFGADPSESKSLKRRTPRRALFTSPIKSSPSKIGTRKLTPRRCLFSPSKASTSSYADMSERKRKRSSLDNGPPLKVSRSSSNSSIASSECVNKRKSSASGSNSIQIANIVEHRKKKLMWAVAEALRPHNVDLKHPQFKIYASILARVIRYFLPNLFVNGPRPEGSTTENMLRIARRHAFAVTRGKSLDDIVNEAKTLQMRPAKPTGYIGLDKVLTESSEARNKDNILTTTTNDSEIGFMKNQRKENVERIRKVIDFDDIGRTSTKR